MEWDRAPMSYKNGNAAIYARQANVNRCLEATWSKKSAIDGMWPICCSDDHYTSTWANDAVQTCEECGEDTHFCTLACACCAVTYERVHLVEKENAGRRCISGVERTPHCRFRFAEVRCVHICTAQRDESTSCLVSACTR
mmetsp:Transcript_13673/g.42277  ORF Transcript_13673/g.42277 Transcript_13673/m.42277 type:complete len:140 (-) Transcript_13673:994-1413(-)